jgi:predicted nucleic acid-binding protein
MVVYWDASALVPLLLREATSDQYRNLARDAEVVTWWGSAVECAAAIECRARAGEAAQSVAAAYRNLTELLSQWREIHASETLRRTAIRFVRTTGVRAGDALHLAGAMLASHFEPTSARFLSEDLRLKQAAEREGFVVD